MEIFYYLGLTLLTDISLYNSRLINFKQTEWFEPKDFCCLHPISLVFLFFLVFSIIVDLPRTHYEINLHECRFRIVYESSLANLRRKFDVVISQWPRNAPSTVEVTLSRDKIYTWMDIR